MNRVLKTLSILTVCVLVTLPLAAQNPTGTISGRVSYEGAALPGVTVIAAASSMQGSKTAITGASGDYIFRGLPPGDFTISFSLDGFKTLEYPVKVSVAQTKSIDAAMYPEAIEEEIVVTGSLETVSTTTQSSITYEQDLIEQLPVQRNLNQAVLLAPGTSNNGPRDAITIAGSQSYENLFLVNGVVVNENLRGQAFDLFIEDAIEETTTSVSGISAEYGRFSGGVVNMITKSGGNEFSGSYRLNLQNDDWNGKTPVTTDQADELDKTHEATFGGYLWQDRLWFFLAGRDRGQTTSNQYYDGSAYSGGQDQTRYEVKLTFSPHTSHRFIGSYINIDTVQYNTTNYTPLEASVLDPSRTLPQELAALNYSGVLSENLFLEAQYSERVFTFMDSGGDAPQGDRINGTHIFYPNINAEAASPLFCASCGDENRDNENYLVKASYFLASDNFGTHDLVFGYDNFNDIRLSNNYQTPSNFNIWNYNDPSYGPNGTFYPVFTGGEELDYWPIFLASRGTDFTTISAFANDTWRVNNKLTINAGLRYDKNDGQDGAGRTVADDDRISPRVGASYDVNGDGNWLINASFGRYVTAIANNVAGSGGAGTPSYFGYLYGGPLINTDGVNTCADDPALCQYTSPEAMAIIFDWFDAEGGLANTDLWYANPAIRGVNLIVEGLKSPYSDEFSIGVTKRLGTRGLVRADYVHRESHDFYATQRDLTTGTVEATVEVAPGVEISQEFDLGYVVNEDNALGRGYDGLHTQIQYRFTDALSLGGNWTWSHAIGNFDGETRGSGPITSGVLNYPEYQVANWQTPTGDLAIDQRHKVRAWLVWDALSSSHHNLSVSWLENFWTGTPYGANQQVVVGAGFWIDNPGYLTPPVWGGYWFTNRDAFRTDNIHRTDIALNYSFFANMFGADIELFVQPEVTNIFNESGAVVHDNTTFSWRNDRSLNLFDPFDSTYTPTEGVDWRKGDNFGQPVNEADYQAPRTFRVSFGIRF